MSDIFDKVKEIVLNDLEVDEAKITEAANFVEDLGADSLDIVELVMSFEETFDIEIPDEAQESIRTVGDAVKAIEELKS